MPNAKTTLRVAMAAVAAPGIIAGMAAPAAHAAELTPDTTSATHSAEGHVSEAQHTTLAQAQHKATKATSAAHTSNSVGSVGTPKSDVTGSDLLASGNHVNGQDVHV